MSVEIVSDSKDYVRAETNKGLGTTEFILRPGQWRRFAALEFATREWVDWFNYRRHPETIINLTPA